MFDQNNFTIVDVETTGGSPFFSRIIEVGLLRVEHGEVIQEFQTLVNPGQEIPEFITKMTGISDADVAYAPTFADIAEELIEYFRNSIFVAHNAQFDYGFLREEFRRVGFGFITPRLCTVRLSRTLFREHKHHDLSSIIERYGFEVEKRHRAFDDAKVLWDFLQFLRINTPQDELGKIFQKILVKIPKNYSNSLDKP